MSCDNYPAKKDVEDFALNARVINEFVTSDSELTHTAASDGRQKTTLAEIWRQANENSVTNSYLYELVHYPWITGSETVLDRVYEYEWETGHRVKLRAKSTGHILTDEPNFSEFLVVGDCNVRDFGAVGDGEADDSSRIQTAIDYVSSNGGGALFVTSGSYRVRQSLFLKEGVQLLGAGGVFIGTVAKSSVIYIRARYGVERNEYSSIKGLRIINSGSSVGDQMSDSAAISFFGNTANPATNGDPNHSGEVLCNTISNNTIVGFVVGVYLGANTFVGRSYTHESNNISDCTYGIYTDNYCEYTLLTSNNINRCQYGIFDNGASNISVTNNQIGNNSEAGIFLSQTGRNTKKFLINGNTINHNVRGVWLGSGVGSVGIPVNECTISSNHILASETYGVVLSGGTDNAVISNTFSGSADGDVYISPTCKRIAVKSNSFDNTIGAPCSIRFVAPAAVDGDKPYHVISDNSHQNYTKKTIVDYPSDITTLPINAANSVINGVFEYWNGAGKPPSTAADNAKANVDPAYIPDGTICKNTASKDGEFWMKLTKPASFDGTHDVAIFVQIKIGE